jgi:hypothetical protein
VFTTRFVQTANVSGFAKTEGGSKGSALSDVERLVGDDPLKPPVLFFELAQAARLRDLQATVLVAPEVKGRVRDPTAPSHRPPPLSAR